MDDLNKSSLIAVSGMKAQAERMRVVSENLANADSLPTSPDATPYRRKTISFRNVLDKTSGADVVKVKKVDVDRSEFQKKYDPKHPAADSSGYVLAPNVNPLIELMDMREAQRSYEANLNIVSVSKSMLSKTVDMLK
ncbi:flagellar basal body rod protein FlgC [Telmatospirillum siberiense]|uniref:Flagellar basal-body rod protein FlgC n=1 Tax=Telmatospirillum siberiense TaxID=382514 RepID=A0A2N3Q043_9PROT|nr:flagellar basal body rod protein FlgC [Telmatospirillum siberiense]PKU26024.1 flagellar basal body rod protein FlgC [Telmatospirillum siberiense]